MCKSTTIVAPTTKGVRIYLEGISKVGWRGGSAYTVTYHDDKIVLSQQWAVGAKTRKVTASKGGVIDLESMKVQRWAQGATSVDITYSPDYITITRSA
jgi:hypothetical protein